MKTMCKRTLAFLLCALLLGGAIPAISASAANMPLSGQYGANVFWTLDESTGTLTIRGSGKMRPIFDGGEESPWSHDTRIKKVVIQDGITSISACAFYACSSLSEVSIPDSVTSIGACAFKSCPLREITIPASVTEIGKNIVEDTYIMNDASNWDNGMLYISDCLLATKDDLPNSVEVQQGTRIICDSAFLFRNDLRFVTLPESLQYIGDDAFLNVTALQSIHLPDSLLSLGTRAFYSCSALTEITGGNNLSSVGESAFEYTAYVKSSSGYIDGFLYVGSVILDADETVVSGDVTVRDGVKGICDYAFWNCHDIRSITIPDSVEQIGKDAFLGCSALESLMIGKNVRRIGRQRLDIVSVDIRLHPENMYLSIEDGIVYNKTKTELIADLAVVRSSFSVPSGVRRIGDRAFYSSWMMTEVTIPNSVTEIGEYAFYHCSLLSVTIPDSMTYIYPYAFASCSAMTEAVIGGVEIGYGMFSGCRSLTAVTLGSGVKYIGYAAFKNCTKLSNVTMGGSVEEISSEAFRNCASLTDLVLPDSVWRIGRSAFIGSGLTHITIPASVIKIGLYFPYPYSYASLESGDAFLGCPNLVSINVDADNPHYSSADGVLYNKDKTMLYQVPAGHPRTSFTVPSGVMLIGDAAFASCAKLNRIMLPTGLIQVGAGAFGGCIGLESITIPDGTVYLMPNVFEWCINLQSVTIPNSVKQINGHVFVIDPYKLTTAELQQHYDQASEAGWNSINGLGLSLEVMREVIAHPGISLTDVYYRGTQEEWNAVRIDAYNEDLLNATIHFVDGEVSDKKDIPLIDPDAGVSAECPDGTFDEETYLRVSQGTSRDPLAEFGVSIKGFATVQQLYYIHVQNEHGEYVQPNAGHKVTLRLPLILDGFGNPYPLEKYGVYHIDSETGSVESFRAKNNNLRIEGGYLVFEVSRFSPFIVTVEQDAPSIKMQDTKKTLPYGEKRTLTVDAENLPDGAKIVWTADNGNVKLNPSADGKTCEVSAEKNGKVTITATVVDKDGKEIKQDGETVSVSVNLNAKANFFHKLWYWITRILRPFPPTVRVK